MSDHPVVKEEQKPRKKTFVPRAPRRRTPPAAAPVVKTEPASEQPPAATEAASATTPPTYPRGGGGRGSRQHRGNSNAVPTGTVFFQPAAPTNRRPNAIPVEKKKAPEYKAPEYNAPPVLYDDDDDPMLGAEDVDEKEDDPLAPIVFETKRIPITVASNEREEDEEEIRRARKSPLYPDENQLFVMQLPTTLPAGLKRRRPADDPTTVDDLSNILQPAGDDEPIGKLQILESGRVRLRLGDEYFDVSSGLECAMLQQIASVSQTTFAVLGNVAKKILVTVPADEEDETMDLSSS